MRYKTFEIINGELFINDIAPITEQTIRNIDAMLSQADQDAENFIDSGADCDEKSNYDWDEQEYGSDLSFLED